MDDVADSTDWLETPLECLAAVERALRCQVCKDFYKTPVITSCSHTFCSICIRRALSSDGKCPLCRASEQELKLRSNWSMEEAVDAFSRSRSTALTLARTSANKATLPKRRAADNDMIDALPTSEAKRLRSSARLSNQQKTQSSRVSPDEQGADFVPASDSDELAETEGDDDQHREPGNDDDLVSCPSCQERMKAWKVFQHLEACPGPEPERDKASPTGHRVFLQTQQSRKRTTIERLPALNYSVMKDQALRKKLSELGLSSQGPRHMLEKRHREWITIWNANCDSTQPKRHFQLLQDLDAWERTHGQQAAYSGNSAAIKDKNFDGAAWAAKHDTSFKDLIATARRTRPGVHRQIKDTIETGDISPTEASSGDTKALQSLSHTGDSNFQPPSNQK